MSEIQLWFNGKMFVSMEIDILKFSIFNFEERVKLREALIKDKCNELIQLYSRQIVYSEYNYKIFILHKSTMME